jgi:hypothetical protein
LHGGFTNREIQAQISQAAAQRQVQLHRKPKIEPKPQEMPKISASKHPSTGDSGGTGLR